VSIILVSQYIDPLIRAKPCTLHSVSIIDEDVINTIQ